MFDLATIKTMNNKEAIRQGGGIVPLELPTNEIEYRLLVMGDGNVFVPSAFPTVRGLEAAQEKAVQLSRENGTVYGVSPV